jgi:hypothetical protein
MSRPDRSGGDSTGRFSAENFFFPGETAMETGQKEVTGLFS